MKRATKTLWVGLALSAVVILLALIGIVWTPHNPYAMNFVQRLRPPGGGYLLGTDDFGRDLLSRIMKGVGLDLLVATMSVLIGGTAGVLIGLVSSSRGILSEIAMRIMDVLYSFPAILTALMLVAVWGSGLLPVTAAISVVNVPVFARLTRSVTLKAQELGYVEAARALGASRGRILFRHLLPQALPPLIIQATTSLSAAFFTEATLSYLALGIQPPTPSLGNILSEAQSFMVLDPWMAVAPGIVMALAVLGFNLSGDGLRDLLDPEQGSARLKHRRQSRSTREAVGAAEEA